jgi:hypothetical protein
MNKIKERELIHGVLFRIMKHFNTKKEAQHYVSVNFYFERKHGNANGYYRILKNSKSGYDLWTGPY